MHASTVVNNTPAITTQSTNTASQANTGPQPLIVSNNKLYKRNDVGPLAGLTEVAFKNETKLNHEWKGKKIPSGLWRQILSFFEWSYETTKSETMVHLYYHEDKGWVALVLPQAGYNSMSISLLPNHEKVAETYARLGEGWGVLTDGGYITGILMGTVHHHCSANAFQSGVDKNDELGTEGIHITVGNIGSAKYSIHGRVSFGGAFTDANFADWFQLSPTIADLLPADMHSAALVGILTKKPTQITFPEWWKENVIKVERPAVIGFQGGYSGGSTANYCGDTRFQGNSYSGKKRKNNHGYNASFWFSNKLNEYCTANKTTYKAILEQIGNIPQDYNNIIKFMITNHRDAEEMKKDINELIDEQEPEDNSTPSVSDEIDALNAMYGTP